tara:strand:+ start:413 stop:709 length:297 start_codon:yes stop_codon:yes gene_type:complete
MEQNLSLSPYETFKTLYKRLQTYTFSRTGSEAVDVDYGETAQFCGWCDSYFSQDDLQKKRYESLIIEHEGYLEIKSFFMVCLECIDKFAYIRTLKEKK